MVNKKGFTIIELTVVMGVLAVLISYTVVNLTSIQRRTYLITTVNTVVSDIKQQQLKAMAGDTEGRSTHDHYGIYFEQDKYVLFHGTAYSVSESTNADINFENNVELSSISFPQSQIVFNGVDGEVAGFVNGSNTLTLQNSLTSEQSTITINRYGVITQIN